MLKVSKPRKTLKVLSLLSLCLITGLLYLNKASAATDTVSLNLNWDNNCSDAPTISSVPSNLYFTSGDTVNLTITNQATQVLDVSINGSGGPLAANGGYEDVSRSLSDTISIRIDPDPAQTSCAYKDNPGYTYIYGADTVTPLSCSISGNDVWTVSGEYSNVAPVDDLYRGSTPDGTYDTTKGGVGSGTYDTSFQYSAQSTPATFYLYDGTSSYDTLLGQATCPAKSPSGTSNPPTSTSTPSQNVSNPGTTANTGPSSPPAATSTQASNSTSAANSKNKPKAATTLKSSSTSFYLYFLVVLLVLAVIAAVLVLTPLKTPAKMLIKKVLPYLQKLHLWPTH